MIERGNSGVMYEHAPLSADSHADSRTQTRETHRIKS